MWLAWCIILLLCYMVYRPGLNSGFVLDDYNNLKGLEQIKELSLRESAPYVLQGFAGPTGRPLSLLSFALQKHRWPEEPSAFKVANLGLHMLNGTLLLLLGLRLQSAMGARDQGYVRAIALMAAGVWLLWPIQVSTVLYTVQRMTILAAMCMICGLLILVTALKANVSGRFWLSHALFGTSMIVGLALGILFKETAALFPLLSLVVLFVFRHSPFTAEPPKLWALSCSLLVLSLASYLLFFRDVLAGYDSRNFTLAERLMTEPRILGGYVLGTIAPTSARLPFFYDGVTVSRGLLTPPSTLFALVVLGATILLSFRLRWAYPIFGFGTLFFLANHVLESSFLPLELAFEHRNYLAIYGPAFVLASASASAYQRLESFRSRTALISGMVTYFSLILMVGVTLSSLWARPLDMAAQRYRHVPESPRAHAAFAEELRGSGFLDTAAHVLERATQKFPDNLYFPMAMVEEACHDVSNATSRVESARRALRRNDTKALSAFAALERLTMRTERSSCPAVSSEDLLGMIRIARDNPAFRRFSNDLIILSGRLYAAAGNVDEARGQLDAAIRAEPRPKWIVQATAWEIGQGNLERAREYLAMLGDSGPLPSRARWAVRHDKEILHAWIQAAEGHRDELE